MGSEARAGDVPSEGDVRTALNELFHHPFALCISCGKRPSHPQGALCDPCVKWMRRPWWQAFRRKP